MSIIHDALKKVQRGLAPKDDETQVTSSTTTQNTSGYIYETLPEIETLPPSDQQTADQKPSIQNKIKSILALICAAGITVASVFYIWQQFQTDVPKAQIFTKKSFDKLIKKIHPLNINPPAPVALKPLALLTIDPSATKTSNSTNLAPITLNIHGIMSNANGNLVLINDHVYQEGDEVDGAKIVKINLDSIMVIINGREQTIIVKN